MASYCVCLRITLSLYVFPCVPGNPLGNILVYVCLILSLALAVWSLFACYSHFLGLTQVTVVHEETIQWMYPWIPLGKPLGKLSTLIILALMVWGWYVCTFAFQESPWASYHCVHVSHSHVICMWPCVLGKPLAKVCPVCLFSILRCDSTSVPLWCSSFLI